MLDSIIFEKLGVPSAPIITRPFEATCVALAELQAMPDYGFVMVDHPITSLGMDELRERARAAAPYVEALLVDGVPWPDVDADADTDTDTETIAEPLTDAATGNLALDALVEELAAGLRADGADLTAEQTGPRAVCFTLHVPDQACAECIMAGEHLLKIFTRRTEHHLGRDVTIDLVDPRDDPRFGERNSP